MGGESSETLGTGGERPTEASGGTETGVGGASSSGDAASPGKTGGAPSGSGGSDPGGGGTSSSTGGMESGTGGSTMTIDCELGAWVAPWGMGEVPSDPCADGETVESLSIGEDFDPSSFNVSCVTGNLSIRHSNLTDLRALSGLRQVQGTINIWNNEALVTLAGIEGITGQVRDVYVHENPLLECAEGLGGIERAGRFRIEDNPKLAGLGLKNLDWINEDLILSNNASLETIGLNALRQVNGPVEIYSDRMLTQLQMNSLANVRGILTIYNSSLTGIDGFESLKQVQALSVTVNGKLKHLDGFGSLETVSYHERSAAIQITQNRELQNISGLFGVTTLGSWLAIRDNRRLDECQVQEFVAHLETLGWEDDTYITPNKLCAGTCSGKLCID